MTSYQRILVTGATGFVGHYLCAALAQRFPTADRAFLRRPTDGAALAGWRSLDGDISDATALAATVESLQPDLVAHLAAQSSVGASEQNPAATWSVNAGGALALVQALQRCSSPPLLFAISSAEVFGASFSGGACDETTPALPLNAYARSKLMAEEIFRDCHRGQLIIVRPFNHTGPGQDQRFVLPAFAAQIAAIENGRRDPVLHVGDLTAERDFLDVRDVVAAYLALLEIASELPQQSLFTVCRSEAYPLDSLVEELRRLSTAAFEIVVDPGRLRRSPLPRAAGKADRLRDATGWAPQRSMTETLSNLLDYWRGQPSP